MITCTDLVAFADGELSRDDAWAFRTHLQTCEDCRAKLPEVVAISAQLSTMQPPSDAEYRAARSELIYLKSLIKIWVDAVDAWEACTIADPKFGRISSAKVVADHALRATVAFAARVDAHLTEVDRVTTEHTEPRPGLGSPDAFAAALDAAAAESSHPALATLIAQLPDRPPPEGWQDRVHAELDVAEVLEAMSPEQIAELDAMTRGMSVPTLDGIDQSEPTTEPDEPLTEAPDVHNEPTRVDIPIDDEFDHGGES